MASSFPIIKTVVSDIGDLSYTWVHNLITITCLTLHAIYKMLRYGKCRDVVLGELTTSIAYV